MALQDDRVLVQDVWLNWFRDELSDTSTQKDAMLKFMEYYDHFEAGLIGEYMEIMQQKPNVIPMVIRIIYRCGLVVHHILRYLSDLRPDAPFKASDIPQMGTDSKCEDSGAVSVLSTDQCLSQRESLSSDGPLGDGHEVPLFHIPTINTFPSSKIEVERQTLFQGAPTQSILDDLISRSANQQNPSLHTKSSVDENGPQRQSNVSRLSNDNPSSPIENEPSESLSRGASSIETSSTSKLDDPLALHSKPSGDPGSLNNPIALSESTSTIITASLVSPSMESSSTANKGNNNEYVFLYIAFFSIYMYRHGPFRSNSSFLQKRDQRDKMEVLCLPTTNCDSV